MANSIIETKYPLSFRKEEAKKLGEHLRLRHSVEIIGMKRVGISDFLRFFLYRRGIISKYIDKQQFHLFVTVDLNDLIEREVYPFWILTFKRLVDAVEKFKVKESLRKEIAVLFLNSIQSGDLFLTVENIRTAFRKIVDEGIVPTVFFIRFDRIIDNITPDFFANLEGLYDAASQRLSYVFTSFRTIDEISKIELERNFLHVFSNIIYIKPAKVGDIKVIYNAFRRCYKISFGGDVFKKLVEVCCGHVQYLHLAVMVLSQKSQERKVRKDEVFALLSADE